MAPAVYLPSIAALTASSTSITSLHASHGAKPPQSLLHRNGRCLAASAGALSQRACDGMPDQAFRGLSDGRVEHVASGQCFLRVAPETWDVELGDCMSAGSWQPLAVEWRAEGGRCVSVRTPPTTSGPLGTESCSSSRASDQTWRFEFLGDAKLRIRQSNACVLRPNDWSSPATAELGTCDNVRDTFQISGGRLEMAGLCLQSGTPLSFWPCSANPRQRFALSGPLYTEGGALTLEDTNSADLTISPIDGAPSAAQIFDYQL
jgi:hypothetical protein